jgi:tripartite motif-containing protein 71
MIFTNFLDPFGQNKTISNTFANNGISNTTSSADIFGAIGTIITANTMSHQFGQITPSTSPHTNTSSSNGSSSSQSTHCGRCDSLSFSRCLDCNDVLCDDCVNIHKNNTFTKDHYIIGMNLNPIGGGPYNSNSEVGTELQCEIHGEALRFLDESCRKIICQECTLKDHKECVNTPVTNITNENGKEKLRAVLESGKLGIKYIKSSIDRAVTYSQSVERDAMEASSRVRKAMRHFIMAAEDRERALLEQVDKYRQQKLTSLSDQMTGLRSALAGLAQVSDKLTKSIDNCNTMSCIDIATTLTNSESQIEKFALMYKNLQPKEEFITFVPPNFELLQDIRMQGEIVMNVKNANGTSNGNNSTIPSPLLQTSLSQPNLSASSVSVNSTSMAMARRPIVRNPTNGQQQSRPLAWDTAPSGKPTMAAVLRQSTTPIGQCIPGSNAHVSAKPALGPSTTFGFDGQEDGQVSRPWGLCVDKENNILVADRRNNRVQVFYPDGTFKFKFGSKGTGNGQFDLPAGICTDPQNRIVVVDKGKQLSLQEFLNMGYMNACFKCGELTLMPFAYNTQLVPKKYCSSSKQKQC